jgi:uncharacterized protein (DUF58 family)
MISSDFLKKIRRIQIITSRKVSDCFAGQYHSVFKGRGIEFSEVREYMPGDEIRSIDWNVTARTGHPHVKTFVEERELTVMILLDVSSSCIFSTTKQLKSQLAAEICSVLAFSAIKNNDKVGFIAFDDSPQKFLAPQKGTRHVLRVIREALHYSTLAHRQDSRRATDLNAALEYLTRVTRRRAVVFILSDFYAFKRGPQEDEFDFKKKLTVANKRHDCIAVTLTDPKELELPDTGLIQLDDAETGESLIVDTSDPLTRRSYQVSSLKRLKQRSDLFNSINVDHIDIRTDIPYEKPLVKFFKLRERRFR